MKITINLDTQAVITQPSPLRFKAGGFVPVAIAFTRVSQNVSLPQGAVIEFALKSRNQWTGGLLAYLNAFDLTSGNLYMGTLNCASVSLLGALGLNDPTPLNDLPQLEASAEVTWSVGNQKFRSVTFPVIVDTPLTDDNPVATPDPVLYPPPSEVARKSDIPAPPDLTPYALKSDLVSLSIPSVNISDATPLGRALLTATEDAASALDGSETVPAQQGGAIRQLAMPTLTSYIGSVIGATDSNRIVVTDRFALANLPTPDVNGNAVSKVHVGDVVHQAGTPAAPRAAVVQCVDHAITDDDVNNGYGIRFFDENGTEAMFAFSWFGGSGTTVSAADLANAFANQINCSGLNIYGNVTGDGTQVTVTSYTSGPLPSAWTLQDDSGGASMTVTEGTSNLPPGDFIVADLANLGNASGFQGIGDTVDFLSGYGAPTADIGEEGNGYVDLNNGDFYHRDASGWQFVLNIKGPQGDQGEQGPIGTGDLRPPALDIAKLALKQWPNSVYCNVGGWPQGICFDGSNIWVTSNNTVTKVAVSTASVVGTYPVGNLPFDVCFDGTNVWTANYNGNSVTKVAASNGSVAGTYATGQRPFAICFDGTNIWTANSGDGTVSKILASNGSVAGICNVGLYPEGICFDGTNIWVTNNGSSSVTKLLASTGAVVGTYAIGSYSAPWGVCFDGTYIWVAASSAGQVFKLLASTGDIVGSYAVGASPSFVCFDGMNVWVTLQGESCIAKILASTGTVIGKYQTGAVPHGNCFDGTNIWVAGDNGVTKI